MVNVVKVQFSALDTENTIFAFIDVYINLFIYFLRQI